VQKAFKTDWHNADNEFHDFDVEQLNITSVLVFEGLTYKLTASYWCALVVLSDDPAV
jgi:hypothetical protein